ncbi:hypothetical protein LRY65_04820 [Candidatus Woesebacteria bacterium]|nr:hypothetical protein [Candidatus Woesebacteria bacterium]MCD8506887.1 hypothetical protein [Candidatus Woesebacteria bacterium]MCD8527494.1 hypothetical protein [Candidatus Woesebacteria bacterium]MCD8546235.1 hypothetical protein [Candidatus Woesebacteria bacterium]
MAVELSNSLTFHYYPTSELALGDRVVGNGRRRKAFEQGTDRHWGKAEAADSAEEVQGGVFAIAVAKCLMGFDNMPESYRDTIVSGDIMPRIGTEFFKKPQNTDYSQEIKANFARLSEEKGIYTLESSTAVGTRGEHENPDIRSFGLATQLHINNDTLRELQTDQGFSKYQKMFEELNGHSFTLANVAGGLCAEVLFALNAVESVDGVNIQECSHQEILEAVSTKDTELYWAIYGSLYTAIYTISPFAMEYTEKKKQSTKTKNSLPDIVDRLSSMPDIETLTLRVLMKMAQNKPYITR